MNRRMVFYVLGRILIVTAALMIPSVVVALLYGEGWAGVFPFLVTMVGMSLVGGVLSFRRPEDMTYYMKEGFVIVALTWIVLSMSGAMPFYISGWIPKFYDAFFETSSGFTTTGASILTNVEALPHSLLFWRSFTHMIGGMGILVFALAVMPHTESKEVHVMRAEMPGPTFGKLRSRVQSTAQVLYVIYIVMTLVLVVLLLSGGMPLFDSFIHAFGAAGTGGFSSKALSVGAYNSTYIEIVLGIAMLVFGTNFTLYFLILNKRAKQAAKSEELRWFIAIVVIAIVAISINLRNAYENVGTLLRDSLYGLFHYFDDRLCDGRLYVLVAFLAFHSPFIDVCRQYGRFDSRRSQSEPRGYLFQNVYSRDSAQYQSESCPAAPFRGQTALQTDSPANHALSDCLCDRVHNDYDCRHL